MIETSAENKKILEAFEGLRVADIRDGMDWCGYMHYGSVSKEIKPIFRTLKIGIARTWKHLPYQGPVPFLTGDDYTKWAYDHYYKEVNFLGHFDHIEKGDFICLDQCGMDVGLIGSNSGLAGIREGAVGWISNGTVRDSDEMILEKVPFWGTGCAQPMVQGRLVYETEQVPIVIGGVVIYPGDVIAADGDGVVVVPRKIAFDVAKYARRELDNDKVGRRQLYEDLGMELDSSVM